MTFPKDKAFNVKVKSFDQAVQMATTKRKVGGCYEKHGDGYIVYWLSKFDPLVKQFAW